jgi:TrmH family RNA methyltransferase
MSERVKEVTSPANPHIKDIKALFLRKYRKQTGLFLAEGLRTLIEAAELGAKFQQLVYLADLRDKPEIARLRKVCAEQNGHILEVNEQVLEKISRKDNPQAVIGVLKQNLRSLKDVPTSNAGCWVALENIHDPGNLGTIIRTVDSVGAKGVILVGNTCDPYSVEAVRATMGSLFTVPIVAAREDDFLTWCKTFQGQIIGTTLQDSVDFRSVSYGNDLLIVMGNEQSGLPDAYRNACNTLIRLPMDGRADSLNLAVATGITLYAALHPWQA